MFSFHLLRSSQIVFHIWNLILLTTFNCFDQFLKKSLVNCQNKGQWFAIDRFRSDKTNFFERILCNFCSFPYQYCDLFLAEKERKGYWILLYSSRERSALIVYKVGVCFWSIMWQRHNTQINITFISNDCYAAALFP